MIELTKLNYEKYYMNCDLIEIIEQIPDTLITMTTGKKYYALETPGEILGKIKDYKKSVIENCSLQKKQKTQPPREATEEK